MSAATLRDTPQAAALHFKSERLSLATRGKLWVLERIIARHERAAERRLREIPELFALLMEAARDNPVTGVSYADYLTLYEEVRQHRPVELLECGTGLSTIVLAYALAENAREGAPPGRITSMEESREWLANTATRFPEHLKRHVEFVHSDKADGAFKCFRGVRYAAVPERAYDFVFSDGPTRQSPVNGDKLFNLDLLDVIARSATPVRGIVDDHFLTACVLQTVLGPKKARFSAVRKLLFVGPVTRDDLGYLARENFARDLRLVGDTAFRLRFARRT